MAAKRNTLPRTFVEAQEHFSVDSRCQHYLISRRWPDGVRCPQCGTDAIYVDSSRNGWECSKRHPKRKFTLKTGTVFEDSALGWDKWLPCVWLVANSRCGVNSHELARTLNVTQKTAWSMLHRIRLALN